MSHQRLVSGNVQIRSAKKALKPKGDITRSKKKKNSKGISDPTNFLKKAFLTVGSVVYHSSSNRIFSISLIYTSENTEKPSTLAENQHQKFKIVVSFVID